MNGPQLYRHAQVAGVLVSLSGVAGLLLMHSVQSSASPTNIRSVRTPNADDAVRLAVAQVGVTEDAHGGGTIYQKWFTSSRWAVRGAKRDGGSASGYASADWCDMFVSWIGAQLNVKGMGADAYTPRHAQWFKDRGRWGRTPEPGAIVFFSWSGGKAIHDIDHVGMVIKDDHDGTIQTVEGNTDDAVKIRTRDVSKVVGYGYPDYAPASSR